MAVVLRTKNNKKITLLNPAEKSKRYARQMKAGEIKETGKKLSNTDMAWRAGYLAARSDSAKCHNAKKRKR